MELAVATDGVLLRRQLAEAWSEIKTLRRTVAHQARLLSNLASETHPAAPSVNCVYWLYSEARSHEHSWRWHWRRLLPFLDNLGTMPAIEVTPLVWERHLNARRRQEQRGGGTPCDHTLNIELGRAKTMLDWAAANHMIAFNPLRPAKYTRTVSQRETRLTQDDITSLLEHAGELRDRRKPEEDDDGTRASMLKAFVLCCFDSMLRFNEARHIRRDLVAPDGSYQLTGTSTKGRRPRTVVLTPRTLEAIEAVPRHPDTHHVFVGPSGKLLGETTMRCWFRWACERGKLNARVVGKDKRVVPHHLRHAGASEADDAGARATALRDTLGHRKLSTVEKYLHREQRESAKQVAELMTTRATTDRRPPRRVPKFKK